MVFISDWSINYSVAKVDVTCMGDQNLYRGSSGLPDASGDFSGFFDTGTAEFHVSAQDGQPRNFYLYPSLLGAQGANPGQYLFGQILSLTTASLAEFLPLSR